MRTQKKLLAKQKLPHPPSPTPASLFLGPVSYGNCHHLSCNVDIIVLIAIVERLSQNV